MVLQQSHWPFLVYSPGGKNVDANGESTPSLDNNQRLLGRMVSLDVAYGAAVDFYLRSISHYSGAGVAIMDWALGALYAESLRLESHGFRACRKLVRAG